MDVPLLPRELIFEILSYDLKAVWQAHRRLSQKKHLATDELEILYEFRDLLLRNRVIYYDFDVFHQMRLWPPVLRPEVIVFVGELKENTFPTQISKSALLVHGKITDGNCNYNFGPWMKNCHTLAFLGQVNSDRSKQDFICVFRMLLDLQTFCSLEHLILWGNYLEASDVCALEEMLRVLDKLKSIDVRHNLVSINDTYETSIVVLQDDSYDSKQHPATPCRECKMANFVNGDNLKCTKCHHVFCGIKCLFINSPCTSCKSQGRCGHCCGVYWNRCMNCHNCWDGTTCVECHRFACVRCVILQKPSALTCKNCRMTYCSTCAGFQSPEATSQTCCEKCWAFNFTYQNNNTNEDMVSNKKQKLEVQQ